MIDKTYRNPRENEIHPQIQKYLHQIVIESFRNSWDVLLSRILSQFLFWAQWTSDMICGSVQKG